MAQINFAKGEVQCKIVYYGPAESGKTANLQMVQKRSPERICGKLTTIATDSNRTLFFDFLPLNLGKVANIRTKLNLYAVPYIEGHNTLRVLVLEGVDGIVFVADARKERLEANREALENLRANLLHLNRDLGDVPIVFQANKMDLDGAISATRLAQAFDLPHARSIDAVATEGTGVLPSLKAMTGLVLDKVVGMMGAARSGAAAEPHAATAPGAAPDPIPAPARTIEEPVFTPAWHRTVPDEPSTSTSTATGVPSTTRHRPSPGIVHGNQPTAPVKPLNPRQPIEQTQPGPAARPGVRPIQDPGREPAGDPRSEPMRPAARAAGRPGTHHAPPPLEPELKISAQEAESAAQWDDGPITDAFMEASTNPQPFPASGGGMGVVAEAPTKAPGRAVSVGAGGTRGRVRTKPMPAFGWAPIKPKPKARELKRPVGERRQRPRPNWRAEPPTTKQMTAGALAALAWLVATGFLVFYLL